MWRGCVFTVAASTLSEGVDSVKISRPSSSQGRSKWHIFSSKEEGHYAGLHHGSHGQWGCRLCSEHFQVTGHWAFAYAGEACKKKFVYESNLFIKEKQAVLFWIVLVHILSNSSHGVQELALNACTTLVSVEPKLTMATRDRVLQVNDSTNCTLLCFHETWCITIYPGILLLLAESLPCTFNLKCEAWTTTSSSWSHACINCHGAMHGWPYHFFWGSLATLLLCRRHWVSLHCHLKQWVSPILCFQIWPLYCVQYYWPGKLEWNSEVQLWRLFICKNSSHQKYSLF